MADTRRGRSRKKRDERRSDCPISCTLDIVGDKWTLLIIRDLLNGKKRYGEFLESPEGVPTNILAERLKRLEANGLVEKQLYSKRPARHEYQITDKGEALGEVVQGLSIWGLTHLSNTAPLAAQSQAEPAPAPEPAAAAVREEVAEEVPVADPEPVPVEEAVEETTSMPEPVPAASETVGNGRGHEWVAPAEPAPEADGSGNGFHAGEDVPAAAAPESAEDGKTPAPVPAIPPVETDADAEGEPASADEEPVGDEVRPGQEEKDDSQLSLF